ncbi:TPA: phenazine antibiotic biosynthesis protein [Klebsiella variicola subsp. variicola]
MKDMNNGNEYIQKMMKWHFTPETGSKFWLDRIKRLDFDPINDIKTIDDLLRFPNFVDEHRDVPIEDLIPRGLDRSEIITAVYESGGTTGAPKRFVMFEQWFKQYMDWENSHFIDEPKGNVLGVSPSGPHMLADYSKRIADFREGVRFAIDLDPRWVKNIISSGDSLSEKSYIDHILKQSEYILSSQNIVTLITTPPLLSSMVSNTTLKELISEKVKLIIWTGAHMDMDFLDYLTKIIFPNINIRGSYGSTSVLSGTVQRRGDPTSSDIIFDSFSPYVFYRVVDSITKKVVPYGSEGSVVMNYITKYGLVPNSLERDLAIRVPSPTGIGDSLSNIHPVKEIDGKKMIEGVY